MTVNSQDSSFNFQDLLKYFGFLMVIIYLGAGLALLLPGVQIPFLNHNTRLILGIALVLYGLFRAWRAVKIIKNEKSE